MAIGQNFTPFIRRQRSRPWAKVCRAPYVRDRCLATQETPSPRRVRRIRVDGRTWRRWRQTSAACWHWWPPRRTDRTQPSIHRPPEGFWDAGWTSSVPQFARTNLARKTTLNNLHYTVSHKTCDLTFNDKLNYTMSTKKQSQRTFSIILFRTDQNFIKFGGTIPDLFLSLLRTKLQLHFRRIPLPETFYFNDVLENWNRNCVIGESLTIRLLLQPSVSNVAVSLIVWTFWAHSVVLSWLSVLSECWEFLNSGFYCLTVLFIAKMWLVWNVLPAMSIWVQA